MARYSMHLSDVAASKLAPDNVGMLGEGQDHIRVDVDSGSDSREIAAKL